VKAPEPRLEDKLRQLIPYLDGISYGFVTFSRVPPHLRQIDGEPVRLALESAGIIDAKLNLTGKGKTWLLEHDGHGDTTGRSTDD
jgi:hypothetical protein